MHSLRWKMIISTMFAVFVPVFLLNRYAIESLDRFTTSIWEAEMLDTATMCGEIYKSGLSEEKAFALMQRFSDETGMRIQLLDRRAALKFDSHPPIQQSLSPHLKRLPRHYKGATWLATR